MRRVDFSTGDHRLRGTTAESVAGDEKAAGEEVFAGSQFPVEVVVLYGTSTTLLYRPPALSLSLWPPLFFPSSLLYGGG